jgi:hypothetical protein
MKPISTSSNAIEHHFIKMAEGYKPEKKKHLNMFAPQVGNGEDTGKLELVTPTAQAAEQAKSDLKRGLDQTDILDNAINQETKRKKRTFSKSRQRSKKSPQKKKKSRKAGVKKRSSSSKPRKKKLQKSKKRRLKSKKKRRKTKKNQPRYKSGKQKKKTKKKTKKNKTRKK